MRRANNMKRAAPQGTPCPQCGEMKLPHRACQACGHYKGRAVIETGEEDVS